MKASSLDGWRLIVVCESISEFMERVNEEDRIFGGDYRLLRYDEEGDDE